MHKLLQGIHLFQRDVFGEHEEEFVRLVQGQHPEVLFITCSDSRLNPDLLMQARPGDLFVLRNAGNIVPPYGEGPGGEAATIEFALELLMVQHIVVCGHSHCGAMQALLRHEHQAALPATTRWLRLADPTRRLVHERYGHLPDDEQLNVAIQENVLLQLDTIRTHPSAARRLAEGRLNLHAWVYKFETGEVFSFDPRVEQFLPLKVAGYRPSV
ncbi:MAG: carbonic anhydrase [Candidatus Lambdaproteobacteria bacterium]|nr:carbonic anhydrase [Candidatus Lambdaproteobacteria bacterium]